jgi:transmembrane sensor
MKTVVEFPDQGVLAEEAAEWLIRLDGDSPPTRQELETLGQWLNRSPAHRDELERLAALWDRINVLTELAVPLGKPCQESPRARPERAPARGWAIGLRHAFVAASVIGAFALGLLALLRGPAERSLTVANGLYATAVGQQTTTSLPDGSKIILNTNSQIRVDYREEYRQVYLLQGEALFTVAKDAGRPFRVYAGSGRIQAIGTAFSVYLKGEDVEVTVTEGRVSLASVDSPRSSMAMPGAVMAARRDGAASSTTADDEETESLGTLSAGQVATIRTPEQAAAVNAIALKIIEPVSRNELAERLSWRDGVLMFSGDRLEDVVKEVSRYTTVSIKIPDAAVRSVRIGGRFPVGETDVMLAALETNFNLQVTRLGHNQVVVTAGDE